MPADSTFMRQRLAMHGASRLKLGLFGANCSSGRAVTAADERWTGSWPDNLRLARLADEAGIDFMLPIARWKGYGGTTDYQGTTLETFTWATGLLANTKRLTVFGTVHAPLIHPVIAAKACVTADHVGEGRFGLNVVCGWNEGEFEMFGVTQRDHEQRYAYAKEWLNAVKAMWTREDEFDFDGQFIRLKQVRAKPKPYRGTRPLIMNAGASPTGQDFAIHNCDALFSTPASAGSFEEFARFIEQAKGVAAQNGRDLDIYTVGVVTCRPTANEAKEYYRTCVLEQADWGAVDRILAMRKITPASVPMEEFERLRRHTANGLGGLPMIGTPDDVAEEMAKLSAAGVRGIGLSLINYADELPYFCAEVLPRLKKKGLRA
jgi:alkanesulfonate monooxygenase SsuD/methylene tetrahydromethanopterin reductase-like flavin-dependent oxidoreductase (luciferase family)